MKFFCICLSPAIDATVRMNAWPTDGCVIKNAMDTLAPGGKGVNVARWLGKRCQSRSLVPPSAHALPRPKDDVSVACGGLLGEDNAALFEKELAKYGIEDRFMRVPGATRVNEMFVTPQGSFKVNRPAGGKFEGFERFEKFEGFEAFEKGEGVERGDVVVLSGSLPQAWPEETYRVLGEAAKKAGARVVLDASGAALVEGVKAHPDVIKPNAEECEALIGFVPKIPAEFKRANAALKAFCDYPIISDGGAGCWFDGEFVAAPKVEVLDTTAAGDTLLAEWCWRRWGEGERVEKVEGGSDAKTFGRSDISRWAVAAGSAACTMPGGEPPDAAVVEALMRVVDAG